MAKVTIELTDAEFKEILEQLTYLEEDIADIQEKIQEMARGYKKDN